MATGLVIIYFGLVLVAFGLGFIKLKRKKLNSLPGIKQQSVYELTRTKRKPEFFFRPFSGKGKANSIIDWPCAVDEYGKWYRQKYSRQRFK